jgi:glycosyltransferase involved in cell wall biosynthesis
MSVGVVITHFNRVNLLKRTLTSLTFNKEKDIEIVVVDDGSHLSELSALRSLIGKYRDIFNIRLISISSSHKWYSNPCIPFNIGIKEIDSDIIILQSAECIHLGPVIDYTKKLGPGEFMSFACYSLNREQTEQLDSISYDVKDDQQKLLTLINPINDSAITHCEEAGWYNHSIARPLGFHWCNAYNTKDLLDVKMFDERYACGIAYDDNEFIHRCRRDLKLQMVDNPLVLHQWHGLHNYYQKKNPIENQLKQNYNKSLFENITLREYNNDNVVNTLSNTIQYD